MGTGIAWLAIAAALAGLAGDSAAKPLQVVTTTPDLGALVEAVGGDEIEVEVLVKGPQDPHFIEPRPSFVRKLHGADLYVQIGLDLEIGWAPVLLRQARNTRIQPGGRGYLDASVAVEPLEVPLARIDRSSGDVHPYGNPHYLTDPINGLRVANLMRDTLTALRPEAADGFSQRYDAFARKLMSALVGPELVERHGVVTVAARVEDGTLASFLEQNGQQELLGGWLGRMRPQAGVRAVQDHNMWPYFAHRFGLVMIDTLEPKPGIAPTTRHLSQVVSRVEAQDGRLVLASPYFDPRHARFVADRTGARVVEMAHQPGARDGTDDYIATVDYNVRRVVGTP